MNKLILILIFSVYLASHACCQIRRNPILFVLSKQAIGKTFSFDSTTNADGKNIIQIKYLGKVETNNHTKYNVLTWARIWGANEHTTGVIFLYNIANKYVGKYVLGSMFDLPSKIHGNNLIFTNKDKEECDKSIFSKISFDSIPHNIFIKCKGDDGDVYSYTSLN